MKEGDEMSDDERSRRLEEAYATLAEMYRQLPDPRRKFASVKEAEAWLVETVGKRTYSQVDINTQLSDLVEDVRRKNAEAKGQVDRESRQMPNKQLTRESFENLCNELRQNLSKEGWFAPATDENVRSTVITRLWEKVWHETGEPDGATYEEHWVTPDEKSLNDKRREETINMVRNSTEEYFLPGPLIDRLVKDVIDSWHKRGRP
jgi:hypothetical protein